MILRFGDYPALSEWAQHNHKGPNNWKRDAGESGSDSERDRSWTHLVLDNNWVNVDEYWLPF